MSSTETIQWELVEADKLPGELELSIASATGRIGLQSMHIAYDKVTEPLFDKLTDKFVANPGLALASFFLPDDYSRVHFDTDKERDNAGYLKDRVELYESLGVTARFTHTYGSGILGSLHAKRLKEMRRNHRKAYVCDNESYSFGGCNLAGHALTHNIDYMLHTRSQRVADLLFTIIQEDADEHLPKLDKVHKVDDKNVVIQDGGQHGHSAILDAAHELLEAAEPGSIRFTSQYRPAFRIERILHEQKPKLVAFNHSARLTGPMIRIQQAFEQLHPALPNLTYPHEERYVHAKFMSMVVRRGMTRWCPDGGPVVLTGSHNFHRGGVMMGTKEIALVSTDETLVSKINTWADQQFGVCS